MGTLIPKLKSRTEGKFKGPGTVGVPFPGYPETLMPISLPEAQQAALAASGGAISGGAGSGSSKKKGGKK